VRSQDKLEHSFVCVWYCVEDGSRSRCPHCSVHFAGLSPQNGSATKYNVAEMIIPVSTVLLLSWRSLLVTYMRSSR